MESIAPPPGGLVYLAGAVDAVPGVDARAWREQAIEDMHERGLTTFSPPHAFALGVTPPEVCQGIIRVNNTAVLASHALIVNGHGQSWGTSLECELAADHEIPVFVFGGSEYSIYRHRYQCWKATYLEALGVFDEWLVTSGH